MGAMLATKGKMSKFAVDITGAETSFCYICQHRFVTPSIHKL